MRHLQGKMLASEKRKLVRMFHAYMQELGATKHDGYFSYQYALDTKAGPLELSATLSPSGVNIFTRFKDAKRGAEITGNSNPFSGKWNYHYLSRMTAEDAMENLRLHMDYVLPSSKWWYREASSKRAERLRKAKEKEAAQARGEKLETGEPEGGF